MTFAGAVRDGFVKYATFTGRSSRPAYWWFQLFVVLVVIAGYVLDAILGTVLFSVITGLGLLLPNLTVLVRRLHDTGRTGWWALLELLPFVGAIVLFVFALLPSDGPNRWGEGPDTQVDRGAPAGAL